MFHAASSITPGVSTQRVPASRTARRIASSCVYISQVVVTPFRSDSAAASVIPQ
jgi:hypothetical protein